MFNFYLPQYNPANLTGVCGGAISSIPLSGYLGELFEHVEAPPSGASAYYQYRKVYLKNENSTSSTETRVWLDAVQHPEQIGIALETTSNQTIATPETAPTGVSVWYAPTNYAEGLDLGTITASSASGLWIREKLANIQQSDPYATFRLYIGGIIL